MRNAKTSCIISQALVFLIDEKRGITHVFGMLSFSEV